jgi:hypothetical protein
MMPAQREIVAILPIVAGVMSQSLINSGVTS